jgi:ACS family tartrate transporter-like MFS transporter
VGWVKDTTGSFAGGIYVLAGFALMSALVTLLCLPHDRHVAAPGSELAESPAE